jgi:lysophospholipase L1-like esterase
MKSQLQNFILFISMLHCSMLLSQDWGNLAKYAEANAKLSAPKAGEERIIFFGNSITESWVTMRPTFFENHPNFIGRGIGGQTTPQMLVRFRADVVSLKPAKVVILAGINDIAENTGPIAIEETAGNIFSMAELAKANGIEAVICSVLPAFHFPWRPGIEPAPKVLALNDLLKNYAESNGLRYVDYYATMVDHQGGLQAELTYDGVHPNEAGYAVMEDIFLEKKSK